MQLPSALLDAFFPLYLLQWGIVLFNILLHTIVVSRGSWTGLKHALAQQRVPASPYWVVLGSILLLQFVGGTLLWALDVPAVFFLYFSLGLMLILTVAPWWGLYGLVRYYSCAQGLGMTIGVCVWPSLVTQPYRLWFALGSLFCYTLLFIVTAQWRHHET